MRLVLFAITLALLGLAVLAPRDAGARSYSAIVIDADSGRVLYARNAENQRYPASLTKMMTLYLAFEALEKGRLKPGQRLKVSKRAQGMPASKLGLKRGSTITVQDAILSLVTKSANDAAVVLAEAMGGTEVEFAKLMTAKARQLGMTKTAFRNASGLPNRRQLSTARDMAALAQALIRDYPQHYHVFSATSFKYNGRRYRNHNRLLKTYAGTDGIKTGYIRASGYNLVASTVRRGKRLIAVVFGGKSARSRDSHITKLLNQGFDQMPRGIASIPAPPRRNPFQVAALPPRAILASAVAPPAPPVESNKKIVVAKATPQAVAQPKKPASAKIGTAQVGLATGANTVNRALKATNVASKGLPPVPPAATAQRVAKATPSQQSVAVPLEANWGVQVGAYSNFGPAHSAVTQATQTLPDLLLSTKTVISQISSDNGPLYRAQLTGLSEPRAREACRLLTSAEINCVVVPPQIGAGGGAETG